MTRLLGTWLLGLLLVYLPAHTVSATGPATIQWVTWNGHTAGRALISENNVSQSPVMVQALVSNLACFTGTPIDAVRLLNQAINRNPSETCTLAVVSKSQRVTLGHCEQGNSLYSYTLGACINE